MRTKFKKYSLILAFVNYHNWLDALHPFKIGEMSDLIYVPALYFYLLHAVKAQLK